MTKSQKRPIHLLSNFPVVYPQDILVATPPESGNVILLSFLEQSRSNTIMHVCLCGMPKLIQQLLILNIDVLLENKSIYDWFRNICLSHS